MPKGHQGSLKTMKFFRLAALLGSVREGFIYYSFILKDRKNLPDLKKKSASD